MLTALVKIIAFTEVYMISKHNTMAAIDGYT
jgi:hypothetical protein